MLIGIAAAILVLGVLIVVHEFGHFLVAKWAGVGVLRFSVGFGPRLFGRTYRGTEYTLSAIPFGGYVKMVGEDPEATEPVDPRISFSHQPLWKRAAIVLAGPGFNLLFAFLVFALVFAVYGERVPLERAEVGAVEKTMPAERAGIRAGDVVTAVDGRPIATWEALSTAIRASGGRPIALSVTRQGEALQFTVTPESKPRKNIFGEVQGEAYLIGIGQGEEQVAVGPLQAIASAARQTVWVVQTLVLSIAKILQGKIDSSDIGGPVLILQTAAQGARLGLEWLLGFTAFISINLGVLNLLPIPILDGGHLLFCIIEAVRRRPLEMRHREIAQQVGLVILLALMTFAFYNDIARIVRGWG